MGNRCQRCFDRESWSPTSWANAARPTGGPSAPAASSRPASAFSDNFENGLGSRTTSAASQATGIAGVYSEAAQQAEAGQEDRRIGNHPSPTPIRLPTVIYEQDGEVSSAHQDVTHSFDLASPNQSTPTQPMGRINVEFTQEEKDRDRAPQLQTLRTSNLDGSLKPI